MSAYRRSIGVEQGERQGPTLEGLSGPSPPAHPLPGLCGTLCPLEVVPEPPSPGLEAYLRATLQVTYIFPGVYYGLSKY